MATTNDPCKVVTGMVRFSYAHVFTPTSINDGDDKKYSISLIIPKKDKATIAKIEAAIEAAVEQGIKSKFGGKKPKNLKLPLRDGDEDREDQDEYANSFFINASSTKKPGIVDESMDAIMTAEDFYSGCYGRASIRFYAYDSNGSKGIAVGLNNLQKLKDGEPLGGLTSTPEDDFGDDDLG
jgi:Protein of unknown function (DUF2815)